MTVSVAVHHRQTTHKQNTQTCFCASVILTLSVDLDIQTLPSIRAILALRARTARPLSKSRRPIASNHATPLRNIQLLNVDDFLDDVVSCLHFPLIVQQRLSDGDTLDQPHAGQIRD